jgi:hypothetical protein
MMMMITLVVIVVVYFICSFSRIHLNIKVEVILLTVRTPFDGKNAIAINTHLTSSLHREAESKIKRPGAE